MQKFRHESVSWFYGARSKAVRVNKRRIDSEILRKFHNWSKRKKRKKHERVKKFFLKLLRMSKKSCNFAPKLAKIEDMNKYETINTENDELMIREEFEALLEDYRQTPHRQKIELITDCFEFAKQAHAGIRRRSGEPYIMHPLAVARIVVKEMGLGSTSICSALLHDVVEDTDYTVEDIEQRFGPKIASIVEGLTKISGGVFGEQASIQAENFRKLILTMSEDIRVILIKIADRLHNMRTLEAQPVEKQYKIAGETLYIYAPLAHRLGLFPIKTELENLAFKYEHPETYAQIEERLQADKHLQMETFEKFAEPVRKKLKAMGYEFKLEARIKSVYSIWKKMQTKNVPFDGVYDLLAVRIIFKPNPDMSEKDQCWMIYSALTQYYKPHPERIRDWISTPKANGYEALHVTLMTQDGEWVEVQIRTERMHEIAERGLAAHWRYKTGFEDESELDKWIRAIQEMLKHPEPDAIDFMDTFKLNLFADEVFVFTPHGEIKIMPQGSTALDFAYMLHTDLGEHCIGAKVNHKLEPLSYVLQGGDQVEVLTSHLQKPQLEWLNWATTAKAKENLKRRLRRDGVQIPDLQKKPDKKEYSKWNPLRYLPRSRRITITDDSLNGEHVIAPCCQPIPGDDVLGFMEDNGVISIHKRDCPEAEALKAKHGQQLYVAEWKVTDKHSFPCTIFIEGIDKVGMVIEILLVISQKFRLNIGRIDLTSKDGIFSGNVRIYTHSTNEVEELCKELRAIEEVNVAQRLNFEPNE